MLFCWPACAAWRFRAYPMSVAWSESPAWMEAMDSEKWPFSSVRANFTVFAPRMSDTATRANGRPSAWSLTTPLMLT